MYGCQNSAIKKAEHLRIDPFELWCWRRLLRVPWNARKLNQSILKEINPGISLEGMMLLATSCEVLIHWKRLWCWEGFGAGGEGDDRGWDAWMASRTRWTWVWVNSGRWWWTGGPGVLWFMGSQSQTRLSDWTELNWLMTITVWLKSLTYLLWTCGVKTANICNTHYFIPRPWECVTRDVKAIVWLSL